MKQVLLIDDDAAVRAALSQTLQLADLDVIVCSAFIEAKDHISAEFKGIILTDIRMPGRDGFYVLDYVMNCDADLPVVMLTGEGDIPMVVKAIGQGAFDFLEKPCPPDALLPVIDRAIKHRELVLENRDLKAQVAQTDPAARMVFGLSDQSETLRQTIRKAAHSGTEAIVTGAAGTGITKVAEVIHLCSNAAKGPFVKRASQGLERNELCHVYDACDQGTLFLDDIEDLPKDAQLALLDLIEEKGGTRVIAGTTQSLGEDGLATRLMADLYYRLTTMPVRIPSLAERPEDIPVLFRRYVAQAADQSGITAPNITADIEANIMSQPWPGNARSLMSYAMRFVLGVEDATSQNAEEQGLVDQLAKVERRLLVDALSRHKGRATLAAEYLKLPRKTFYDKLAKYGIRSEEYRV